MAGPFFLFVSLRLVYSGAEETPIGHAHHSPVP